MAVELITGYTDDDHVSSADDGARQAGTVGPGMYVMDTGQGLAATLENANTVTVAPGDVLMNGRHVRLTGGTTFAVPVGTQGMKTASLLALRYEVGPDGKESVEPLTLTGEPSEGEPADPETSAGSILDGDSPVDMPLYRVVTTGIETAQPERLFETAPTLLSVRDEVRPIEAGGTGAATAEEALANLLEPVAETESSAMNDTTPVLYKNISDDQAGAALTIKGSKVWEYIKAKGASAFVCSPAKSRARAGSKVVNIASGAGTLFTSSQITSLLGVSYNQGTTAVLVSNGDSAVGEIQIAAQQNPGGIYVVCTKAYTNTPIANTSVRFNYLIFDSR